MHAMRSRSLAALAVLAAVVLATPLPAPSAQAADSGPRATGGIDGRVGESIHTTMPDDPTAVVLGSVDFPVHGDGIGDDTAAIQAAIDEASRRGGENWLGNIVGGARNLEVGDGGGVVFVPEGRYRVTDRIELWADVRLIGFGETRPEFFVAPGTAAFQGEPERVFAAMRRPYVEGGTVSFANSDTFGTGLVNVDITVAEGNRGAIGVRFNGAQLFVLQDVDIEMGDGYAGIDHNANVIQRVNVRGGQVGLLAFAASPGWQTTIMDSSFTGQSEAAIRLFTDAKLSIIRTHIADVPLGIEATPAQTQRLYVQDSIFERVTGAAITLNDSASIPAADETELVRGQNQLNVISSGVVDSGALLRTLPSGSTWSLPDPSYLVNEATFGLRVSDALSDQESRSSAVVVDATALAPQALERMLVSDVPLPPASDSWVNVAEFAAERGQTVGAGGDDVAVFQAALDAHETVYVPMGRYSFSRTLELNAHNNLIGLHPRQTWLVIPDEAPWFSDPEHPQAIISTPPGGANFVTGLGLDTNRTNPGAAQVHWRSGAHSHLSDATTQFVKWSPDETAPGDPGPGLPGYEYQGKTRYNFWIDGGGGTFVNLWAASGWADNGLLIENTDVPGRLYEVSIEHHQHHEVVLHGVEGWELHALQTEDHIYGWESEAVELVDVHDVLFANTVFFRVATVLGPYPHAIGTHDSTDVVVRGTRGYRPDNIANTRWGATITDVASGRTVPELEVAYLGVTDDQAPVRPSGLRVTLDNNRLIALPGATVTANVVLTNAGPQALREVTVAAAAPDAFDVAAEVPASQLPGQSDMRIPVTITVPSSAENGSSYPIDLTVTVRSGNQVHDIEQRVTVPVGGTNLARGAKVVASSTLSSNVAANAVDGATGGARWISAAGDAVPTLTMDLGQPADVNRLVLYSGVEGSTSLRVVGVDVEGLVDGQWHPIGTLASNGVSPVTVALDPPGQVSQVRLTFTEPSPSDTLARVFEIEIYGLGA